MLVSEFRAADKVQVPALVPSVLSTEVQIVDLHTWDNFGDVLEAPAEPVLPGLVLAVLELGQMILMVAVVYYYFVPEHID